MQDFMNRAGKIAKDAASKAADKTGEVVETAKIKTKISNAKSEIEDNQRKIGAHYFDQYLSKAEMDEQILAYCQEIEIQMQLIDDLEKRIKEK